MKEISLFAALGLLALASGPHAAPWQSAPADEPAKAAPPAEIALWPEGLAIARPETTGPEKVRPGGGPIAGKPVAMIENVTRPTMTFYPAKGRNTGATILVFPGGGYQVLAIDLEGTEVCDWATARGISCAVLKYRVPQFWWHKGVENPPRPQMALQDAQRAMGLLRQRAAALAIDPHKIGVLGFSAGGHLVSAISNASGRNYAPVDAADRLSARPDFAVALYPGHLWAQRGVELYPFDSIRADAPPTFLVQAQDDPVDDVRHSISYFLALRAVKVPVEMHIYAKGGHAFGLRPSDQPITRWPELMDRWLHTIGVL